MNRLYRTLLTGAALLLLHSSVNAQMHYHFKVSGVETPGTDADQILLVLQKTSRSDQCSFDPTTQYFTAETTKKFDQQSFIEIINYQGYTLSSDIEPYDPEIFAVDQHLPPDFPSISMVTSQSELKAYQEEKLNWKNTYPGRYLYYFDSPAPVVSSQEPSYQDTGYPALDKLRYQQLKAAYHAQSTGVDEREVYTSAALQSMSIAEQEAVLSRPDLFIVQ